MAFDGPPPQPDPGRAQRMNEAMIAKLRLALGGLHMTNAQLEAQVEIMTAEATDMRGELGELRSELTRLKAVLDENGQRQAGGGPAGASG